MRLGLGMALGPHPRGVGPFAPFHPYALWDAEDASTITRSGSIVTAWRDCVGGLRLEDGTGSTVSYSPTAFNGRPGLTVLSGGPSIASTTTGQLPLGADPCEIWWCGDQPVAATDTAVRVLLTYGLGTTTIRSLRRVVVTGANVARLNVNGTGTQNINATGNFLGRSVVRAVITGSQGRCDLNGTEGTSASLTPNTSAGTAVFGSVNGGLIFSAVGVFPLLSADQATALYALLNARKA
jgi:hypothetical protein